MDINDDLNTVKYGQEVEQVTDESGRIMKHLHEMQVPATSRLPCVMGKDHRPVPRFTELHHVFPMYLQKRVWGAVRDQTKEPTCGNHHTLVHEAIDHYEGFGEWPKWCRGETRDMAERGWKMYVAALRERGSHQPLPATMLQPVDFDDSVEEKT